MLIWVAVGAVTLAVVTLASAALYGLSAMLEIRGLRDDISTAKKCIEHTREERDAAQKMFNEPIEKYLNEVELLTLLRGGTVRCPWAATSIVLEYARHPEATLVGLAKFWYDVEILAHEKRVTLGGFPGASAINQALDQKQCDREDRQGYAVRMNEAAVDAVARRSYELPIAKKIAAEMEAQEALVRATFNSAATPEEAEKAVRAPDVTPALKELEHKEEGKSDGAETGKN